MSPQWAGVYRVSSYISDDNSWNGYTIRVVLGAAVVVSGGSMVRVTIGGAAADLPANINKIYIGRGAGSGSVAFADTPTRLAYRGSQTFTLPGASARLILDPVLFPFTEADDLVVSYYMDGAASELPRFRADFSGRANSFYKLGDDAATVAASGYTGGGYANDSMGLFSVEAR